MAWKDWSNDYRELIAPVWADGRRRRKFIMLAGFVLGLWLLWALVGVRLFRFIFMRWFSVDREAESAALAALGQTGDVFGGVNALFAAFAFVGVAIAAYFQYKTFAQLEAQHSRERFEPIFFQLFALVREEKKNLGDAYSLGPSVDWLFHDMTKLGVFEDPVTRQHVVAAVEAVYGEHYREHEPALGPYFRTMYHLFKRINRSRLPYSVQCEYANMVRATISTGEIALLAINCATARGEKFKPLIEGYGLLKHRRVATNEIDDESYAGALSMFIDAIYESTAIQSQQERIMAWHVFARPLPTGFENACAEQPPVAFVRT